MNPILKNILAAVVGIVIGSLVNFGIISISGSIIPPPEGVDMTTTEGLKEGMKLMQPKHFILPFLAHALGVLVGAFIVTKLAASYHFRLAIFIGVWFLLGGIAAVTMMPGAPIWFIALDLLVAYLPMAWLGHKLAS
ncbi:MAG: hypothetical protein AAF960_27415 [Bacteroidota bacterium]